MRKRNPSFLSTRTKFGIGKSKFFNNRYDVQDDLSTIIDWVSHLEDYLGAYSAYQVAPTRRSNVDAKLGELRRILDEIMYEFR